MGCITCSTPKLKPLKQKRAMPTAFSQDMDQSSYSKMIHQANTAYEKRHPESFNKLLPANKRKKQKLTISSKPFLYWVTQSNMTEIKSLLSNYISVN